MVSAGGLAIDVAAVAIEASQYAEHVLARDVFQHDAVISADHVAFFRAVPVMPHHAMQHVLLTAAVQRHIVAAQLALGSY